ncbi:hypothetical protein ACJIZ3_008965 [Penstemon smallii]|uniref:Plastid division protein PDV1 n=1 Tax=Penstemon smallii TaxID=265156 RepID=A0ABD3TBA5_9LAMI
MKWEMEIEEIEVVLEKIWDLHDKLSDAIHTVSRAHFLKNSPHKHDEFYFHRKKKSGDDDSGQKNGSGFVFVKEFRVDSDDSAVHEAKSLYAIRTALENLEDQLEFFHTVQTQQRAERDAAIARLEQSRIILAMRLAEHQGKNYKVIEEAHALVGDVKDASRFSAPEHLYSSTPYPSNDNFVPHDGKNPNPLVNFFVSSFSFVSKSLKLDHTVGILGNAALLALSMLAFVHMNQVGRKENYEYDLNHMQDSSVFSRKVSRSDRTNQLDVMLARG